MIRLSTSTNLVAYRPDWVSFIPILESMDRIKQAGFDALDINLSDAGKSFYSLGQDDYEAWVERVKEKAEALHLPISQSHTPFYNALDSNNAGKKELWEKMIARSIKVSGQLGVKWIVMHPGSMPDDAMDFRLSKQYNYEYFMPYLELADQVGCGIAIENMVDGEADGKRRRPLARYCATHVELCELVDSFKVNNVGICWDFGHAHLMNIHQKEALLYMGKRLKATHVADNSSYADDHILPFMGTVNWREVLPVLKAIGYEGDLTYEIHNATSRLPDELIDPMAKMCEQVGRYLLSLAQ